MRATTLLTLDSRLRTPYYQNFNVSLERLLGSNTVFSVRWVGNKGTKLIQQANVNEINVLENGILDAFKITQAGGNAPLFNKLFVGLPGVDGVNVTGSDFVRSNSSGLQGPLTNNDVAGLAAIINGIALVPGQNGGLLRRVGLPENFIVANPQFGAALLAGNYGNSTYHSLQVGIDKRFAKGWTLQAYYTFSKALGNYDGEDAVLNSNFRTQRNRRLDKTLLSFNRTHAWKANGLWELPFGPGKMFGRNSHGVLGQVLGGWQTGSIFVLQSGAPLSLNAVGAFNGAGNNTPVAAGDVSNSLGQVTRVGNGVVYFDGLKQIVDPYVSQITTINGIQARSTLLAITDASGKLLLENPQPGQLGTVAPRFFTGPGLFQIDLNLLKRFKIKERYDFYLRADAINVTNTVSFSNPDTNINSQTFGRITGITGAPRIVVLSGRFNF